MTLLRLKDAVATYFPGTPITVQTLRGEWRKGRLEITRIGKRDYVTLDAIQEMLKRCQLPRKVLTSSSMRSRGERSSGSSETSSPGEALDALEEIERGLNERSKSISPRPSRRTRKTAALIKLQLLRS